MPSPEKNDPHLEKQTGSSELRKSNPKSGALPGTIIRAFSDPYLELTRLLREASEIEHSLMVQYLYAAFSIKPQYGALRGEGSISESGSLLGVAVEEMNHLHKVNLILTGLGAPPNLHRQDFPYEPDIYPFAMHLKRLTSKTLARYVYAEASSQQLKPGGTCSGKDDGFIERLQKYLPKDARLNHLGSLYDTIIATAKEVQTRPPSFLDSGAKKLAGWIEELEKIKKNGTEDHFCFFKIVFMGKHNAFENFDKKKNIWDLPTKHPDYPSWKAPEDPTAFKGHRRLIKDAALRDLAWLGNMHYWIVLGLLNMTYRYDDWEEPENGQPRPYLELAKRHMRGPLIKLGLHLAEHKSGLPFDLLSIGYSFGRSKELTQCVLSRIVREANKLARELYKEKMLPNGFKLNIYSLTLSQLAAGDLRLNPELL